jgi:predicted RNase H-like HicB family nuclease
LRRGNGVLGDYIDAWYNAVIEAAMKFTIALYPSEEGFAVSASSLPGCWSQGATRAEALENISVAIREYLETEIEPADGAEVQELEVAV